MELSTSRHALRLREGGTQPLVTLKGPGNVADGVHEREELELPTRHLEPAGWPAEISERLRELVGDEQLQPIFEIHNHRRAWPLLEEGRVVGEVALDRGSIEAGGRSQPLHELEVELKGGTGRNILSSIAEMLRRRLPAEPEDRSKFERGVALLGG
jgi:inorganic triphosphatase YgiF